jgi:hypothetical protein
VEGAEDPALQPGSLHLLLGRRVDREVAVGQHLAHGELTDLDEFRLMRQLAGVIHPEQEHLLVLPVGDRPSGMTVAI